MDLKRKSEYDSALVPVKKMRNELAVISNDNNALVESGGVRRISHLQAPIMLLTGHDGDIFCTKFSPNGRLLASAGFDRLVLLWSVFGECENIATMKGHSGAVMDLHYTTDGRFVIDATSIGYWGWINIRNKILQLVTCATDKTLALWDVEVCERMRKFKGHQTFVNACDVARRGPQLLCSGSDDGTVKLWDSRRKVSMQTFQNTYQVTAVCFSDTAEQVISGGIDNDIKVWDLRKNEVLFRMRGHSDTVTGMRLSPDGSYLLTTAMDNTVRIWDVRPFAPQERCVKIFQGNQHIFEKNLLRVAWSPDGGKVSAGSGDRFLYIWDTTSRRILYKLPGHAGSVNDVDFHPTEPIVASGSSDKRIFLGEVE